ncbi:hypothetical protein [Agrococcus sp. Marseille-P2731]|uniref:hypothetical protein n=1 Tax=Agrococcus sp. Marseille-P2731 TaxID=1841862 RepID=UPI0009314383|nr:hypothetical protein [Agrococcus sp. Marseille-P2731]
MLSLLGLAALVLGAIIATRRTRPTWFVVTTCVLVVLGGLLAILSYTRVTDPLGVMPNSVIGWVYVGLSIITMFSAIFVLERRGARGEELPPLIGDNPFDGDTDDSDDPARGTAPDQASAAAAGRDWAAAGGRDAAAAAVLGGAAATGAAGAAAAGAPASASLGAAGTESFAAEAASERARVSADGEAALHSGDTAPHASAEELHANDVGTGSADTTATPKEAGMTRSDAGQIPDDRVPEDQAREFGDPTGADANPAMDAGLRAALGAGGGDPGAHTDERPAEQEHDVPAASDPGPGSDDPTASDLEQEGPR